MHPPLQTKTIFNTNARHTAGRFAFSCFPGEILSELTKVNKVPAISLEPISCKGVILLSVKPDSCNLHEQLTKLRICLLTYHHTNPLTYYPINLLTFYHITPLTFYPIDLLTYLTHFFQVISRGHSITKQRYGFSKDNDRQQR
jgi:hypothetical protein